MKNFKKIMELLSINLIVLLSGCSTYSLNENQQFGITTTQWFKQQLVKKEIDGSNQRAILTDGQSVKSSIDKYQKSFENPTSSSGPQGPVTSNILGLGAR